MEGNAYGWSDGQDITVDRTLLDSTADELEDGCRDSVEDEVSPGENDNDGDRLETLLGLLSRPEDSDEDEGKSAIFTAPPTPENHLWL